MKRRIGLVASALVGLGVVSGVGAESARAYVYESPSIGGKVVRVDTLKSSPTYAAVLVGVRPADSKKFDAAVAVQCSGDGSTQSDVALAYLLSSGDITFVPVGSIPAACPVLP